MSRLAIDASLIENVSLYNFVIVHAVAVLYVRVLF